MEISLVFDGILPSDMRLRPNRRYGNGTSFAVIPSADSKWTLAGTSTTSSFLSSPTPLMRNPPRGVGTNGQNLVMQIDPRDGQLRPILRQLR